MGAPTGGNNPPKPIPVPRPTGGVNALPPNRFDPGLAMLGAGQMSGPVPKPTTGYPSVISPGGSPRPLPITPAQPRPGMPVPQWGRGQPDVGGGAGAVGIGQTLWGGPEPVPGSPPTPPRPTPGMVGSQAGGYPSQGLSPGMSPAPAWGGQPGGGSAGFPTPGSYAGMRTPPMAGGAGEGAVFGSAWSPTGAQTGPPGSAPPMMLGGTQAATPAYTAAMQRLGYGQTPGGWLPPQEGAVPQLSGPMGPLQSWQTPRGTASGYNFGNNLMAMGFRQGPDSRWRLPR